MTMERISKVIGGSPGDYNIDIAEATFGGTEMHIWAEPPSNHDQIVVRLLPEQAETLAASLLRFAEKERGSRFSSHDRLVEDQLAEFRGERL
jgi:hypothetical protein